MRASKPAAASVEEDPWNRVRRGLFAFGVVLVTGFFGYLVLGLSAIDSIYMTVTTVLTVGFREVGDPAEIDDAYRLFTVVLVLVGVGTAFYTVSVTLETLLESRLTDRFRRRRMDREIDRMTGHVIVCGYGRLGRTIADRVAAGQQAVVAIDRDPDRLGAGDHHNVVGDGTDDEVLHRAGLERASTLIAATDDDADNLYITLSARTLRPDLFIIARAKLESSEPKLIQAGADRVVNPQMIGGERIAALCLQPNVAEFLDVVMREEGIEFRLSEIAVSPSSPMVGHSLRDAHLRDRTGALVLAIRAGEGADFHTNPPPETVITGGSLLIAIGTGDQLAQLATLAAPGGSQAPAGLGAVDR
jgi:voltage-gated potassium channel